MKLIDKQTIFDSTPELELLISKLISKSYRYTVNRLENWAVLTDDHNKDVWRVWWSRADDMSTTRVFTDKLSSIEYYKEGCDLPVFKINSVQPYINTIVKFESAFNLEPTESTTADTLNDMIKALPQEDL